MSTRSGNEMPRFNFTFAVAALLGAASLVGCTDSSDGEPIMAVNAAPMFDGDVSVSVSENTLARWPRPSAIDDERRYAHLCHIGRR